MQRSGAMSHCRYTCIYIYIVYIYIVEALSCVCTCMHIHASSDTLQLYTVSTSWNQRFIIHDCINALNRVFQPHTVVAQDGIFSASQHAS